MKRDVEIDLSDKTVFAGIRVIDHIAVTSLEIWADEDANGRPDKHIARVKKPNDRENEVIEIGKPQDLAGQVLQWVWMPSQPPQSTDDWIVELVVKQGETVLAGFPLQIKGAYPSGKTTGIFETWIRFKAKGGQ